VRLEKRLVGTEAVTTSPAGCRALWTHLVGLLNGTRVRPVLLASSGPLIEQECLRLFLALLARSKHDRIACEPHNRARLVRRVEDYMQANRAEPLSVLELCRELGVSERTLHYAFQEVRGTSPMAYFRALRLNAVRQDLRAAADTASVHEIAQRWGFWHTGEFAADYRRLFGELPSQTLNGKPLGRFREVVRQGFSHQTARQETKKGTFIYSMNIPSQHRGDKPPLELFLAGIRDEEPPWQRFFARHLGIDHP
jgi:AraC family ethanolamine operon transcriptional activator